jgi:hypothetical protein
MAWGVRLVSMEAFSEITEDERRDAVAGFVRHNPHLKGIDFDTMIEMILDADAHLVVLEDEPLTPTTARHLVYTLISLKAWAR